MKNKMSRLYKYMLFLLLVSAGGTCVAQSSPEEKLSMTLYAIRHMYVDSVNLSPVVEQQIKELIERLDPHSEYLPPAVARANEQVLTGKTSLGGKSVSLSENGEVPDESALMTPSRNSQDMQESKAPTGILAAYMVKKGIGCITINMFTETTAMAFREKLNDLQKQGLKHLVLNLQKNGGGFYETAIELADEFLHRGQDIVRTEGAHVPLQVVKGQKKGAFEEGKLAVLVSEQTMSAAEIFTGAIQDWDRGVLVGRRTFGKGLIQETLPFSDGSALRLTVAKYHTPCGRSIQKPYQGKSREEYAGELASRSQEENHAIEKGKAYISLRTGRTLYESGGISPDVVVPVDSVPFTNWYALLTYAGVQKQTAREYVSSHKALLTKTYPGIKKFKKLFCGESLLPAACKMAEERAGIPFEQNGFERSKAFVALQLKALVARELFGKDDYYYEIMDEENQALQQAVALLADSQRYQEILNDRRK